MNPMFERPGVESLRKVDRADFVPNFIHDFILDKEANEAATVIQQAFRAYRRKRRWLALIDNKLWRRQDTLKKVFYAWAASCARDVANMQKYYEKEFSLLSEKPWLSRKDEVASFPMFYLCGSFFAPGAISVLDYYYILRSLRKWNGSLFFRLWLYMAQSMKAAREKHRTVRFTIKKRTVLGPVFISFVMWHRYTMWRRKSMEKNDCVKLNCPESIIDWNVKEQALNTRRARLKRANQYSQSRVGKKAVAALYQECIKEQQLAQENEASDQFYNRHMQQKGYRAWMRYIALQRHKHAVTIKILKAWKILSHSGWPIL